jgi:hypothetical protein
MSSRPILLLGASTPARARIHEVLVAAGYQVVIAESAAGARRVSAGSDPRAVVAPVDAEEEWRRLVQAVDEHFHRALPVVIVGQDAVALDGSRAAPRPIVCREPGFGRQLLEEIQYAERTFRPASTAAARRGSRVGMIPIAPRQAAAI